MTRNKSTKLTVDCPEDFTSEERRAYAEKVIEFIQHRTKMGYNVHGRDWSGKAGEYTPEYARKKGVSEGGPVDLALSHDMIEAIQYFPGQSGSGSITVGFKAGTKIERKAEGNILGTYGRADPIPGKARPFLDILKKDLQDIIEEIRDERD
jgi:hypothetical protein